MKLTTLFVVLFFSLSALAQPVARSIAGTVKDAHNEAITGATARLLKAKDSSIVKSEVTNGDGKFRFADLQNGNYLLSITGVGLKRYVSAPLSIDELHSTLNLPVIILLPAKAMELKAVTVTSRRPLIEQDVDKTIVNVDAMISAATSNTLEVLEKTPGVTIDNNGNISLNGKNGILVLIDGRSTYMSGQDLAAYLKSLPGAIVDKIELMDNPPAKYDAAGSAVINIRLKKSKNRGLTGNISSSYSQGVKASTYNVLNLNYNKKKINLFGNIGYSTNGNYSDDYSDRQFFNPGGSLSSRVLLQNNYSYTSQGLSPRAGLDLSVSPKTILGLQVNWQTRPKKENADFESRSYNDLSVLDSVNTGTTTAHYDWNTKGINLNFQHKLNDKGRELSGDLNYINYHNSGMPAYRNFSGTQNTTNFNYDLVSGIDIYSFKSDYSHPLKKKAMLEAGIKSSFVTNDNDSKYFDQQGNNATQVFSRSNHFIYKENINAAYINLRKNWKRLSGQLGLRLENTQLKGNLVANPSVSGSHFKQNFTDLFPTIFFNYKLDSLNKNSIAINFGSRINRPNYQQLNPFLAYRDKYSYTQGNPDLQPQYMYRVELRYQFKQVLSVSMGYAHATNLASQANEARGDTFISRPINIARGRMLSLNTNLTLNPRKWWTFNCNIQVAHFKISGLAYTEKINVSNPAARLSINNQFNFKKGWSGELSGFFSSKDFLGQVYLKPRYRASTAIQKKIWKDRGSIRLSGDDIFHSWLQIENSFAVKQSQFYHRNENDTQRFGIAFTFRFGSDTFARKRKQTENAADSEKGRAE